jgi:NADH-quinone oxidoreductase subunit A
MPPSLLRAHTGIGMPPASHTLSQFVPLLLLLVVGVTVGLVLVGLSWILGPKRPSAAKLAPYECGVTPVGSARERFPVKFYLIAMLFIVFDIETVFLYPWAVTYRHLDHPTQIFYLGEMVLFMVILFVGYIYVWKRGAFEWE